MSAQEALDLRERWYRCLTEHLGVEESAVQESAALQGFARGAQMYQ